MFNYVGLVLMRKSSYIWGHYNNTEYVRNPIVPNGYGWEL